MIWEFRGYNAICMNTVCLGRLLIFFPFCGFLYEYEFEQ